MAGPASALDRDFADASALIPLGWSHRMRPMESDPSDLVALLSSDSVRDEDVLRVATVVFVACRGRAGMRQIAGSDIIPLLVAAYDRTSGKVLDMVTSAILNLTVWSEPAGKLLTAEFKSIVTRRLLDDDDLGSLRATVKMIGSGLQTGDFKEFLLAEGPDVVLGRLVGLLERDDDDVAELAAVALSNLACNAPSRRPQLVSAGATTGVCAVLSRESAPVKAKVSAMEALKNMVDGHREFRATMEAAGVMPALLAGLAGGDAASRLEATELLSCFCREAASRAVIGTGSVADDLVAMLPSGGEPVTAEASAAAELLSGALRKPGVIEKVSGGIEGLVAMLRDVSVPMAAENASLCLDRMLSEAPASATEVLSKGGLLAAIQAHRRGVLFADTIVEFASTA